ncbi:hypothetical protein F2P79_019638 [Pimephales promelas]|nr:hypothetical protein F2P79_019638 [Pimephales promelas]
MSKEICQIQCFSTEALTPRIITPGKPRNSPLNQVGYDDGFFLGDDKKPLSVLVFGPLQAI